MTTTASGAVTPEWPSAPYKGLSYYDPQDAPIFSGRENEVSECAKLLEMPTTRVLVLHGLTACGKSSFLRAGLIPAIERAGAGFEFLRHLEGDTRQALFVRCTDRPLDRLAETVARFIATAPRERVTPLGPEPVDLPKVLPEGAGKIEAEWVEALCANPGLLLETLRGIGRVMSHTMTFIVDQAEEVLTIDQSQRGDLARDQFFEFLALFTQDEIDVKLMVALRTEYYGRFHSRCRRAFANVLTIREYFLDELTPAQMIAAIVRPTSTTIVEGLGSARSRYRFCFEPGLPERIVQDFNESMLAGGAMPALQIVCSTLWERVSARLVENGRDREITSADYAVIGSVTQQVEAHLDLALLALIQKTIPELRLALEEVDKWKLTLVTLVHPQADGTVTTDIVKALDLDERSKEVGCKLAAAGVLSHLALPDVRILRDVYVTDRARHETFLCYSLGHDSVGLVLRRWTLLRQEIIQRARQSNQKIRVYVSLVVVVCIVLLGVIWKWGSFTGWYAMLVYYIVLVAGIAAASAFGEPSVGKLPSPTAVAILLTMSRLIHPRYAQHLLTNSQDARLLRAYPALQQMLLTRSQASETFFDRHFGVGQHFLNGRQS